MVCHAIRTFKAVFSTCPPTPTVGGDIIRNVVKAEPQVIFREVAEAVNNSMPKDSKRTIKNIPKEELTYNTQVLLFYNLEKKLKSILVNQLACMGVTSIVMNHKLVQFFLKNWEIITKDQWVLNMVQGYHIDFLKEQH